MRGQTLGSSASCPCHVGRKTHAAAFQDIQAAVGFNTSPGDGPKWSCGPLSGLSKVKLCCGEPSPGCMESMVVGGKKPLFPGTLLQNSIHTFYNFSWWRREKLAQTLSQKLAREHNARLSPRVHFRLWGWSFPKLGGDIGRASYA